MYNETLKLDLPDRVLDFTEGKRALICGGQGAREEARIRLRKIFELAQLDWNYGERNSRMISVRTKQDVRGGKYDIVFFLTNFMDHTCMQAAKEAREQNMTVIMIPGGYSPQAFSKAIDEQACRNLERQQLAKSSSQTMNYANSGRPVTY